MRWGVAGRMVVAWLVTLPAAALVGGVSASAVKHGGNFGTRGGRPGRRRRRRRHRASLSRRNPVHAHNVNDTHEVTVRSAAPTHASARPPEADRESTESTTMQLDWSALGQVAAVSIGVTVAVVVVFALGVLGLARVEAAREERRRHLHRSASPRPGCASWRARRWWRTGSI